MKDKPGHVIWSRKAGDDDGMNCPQVNRFKRLGEFAEIKGPEYVRVLLERCYDVYQGRIDDNGRPVQQHDIEWIHVPIETLSETKNTVELISE